MPAGSRASSREHVTSLSDRSQPRAAAVPTASHVVPPLTSGTSRCRPAAAALAYRGSAAGPGGRAATLVTHVSTVLYFALHHLYLYSRYLIS